MTGLGAARFQWDPEGALRVEAVSAGSPAYLSLDPEGRIRIEGRRSLP